MGYWETSRYRRVEIAKCLKLMDRYGLGREGPVLTQWQLIQYAEIGWVRAVIIRKIQNGEIAVV